MNLYRMEKSMILKKVSYSSNIKFKFVIQQRKHVFVNSIEETRNNVIFL